MDLENFANTFVSHAFVFDQAIVVGGFLKNIPCCPLHKVRPNRTNMNSDRSLNTGRFHILFNIIGVAFLSDTKDEKPLGE